ncbi:uncharacterized protein LOC133177300 [Saccostrea echinata]|uniref:uncharacterized protein LOC133177300 n=1 Tax=Saccostrea echinata TaxID=191078 RepID=UPI002A83A03E|nr:uncharacterized protein LOC133177300 [Saccostrea echinata]
MYGDGCQFRCECDNSSCNPLIGCRATITALQDDRVLTIQYELSSIFSTPPTAESKIKVIRNTAKSLDMTVNKRPTTQYHHSRNGIYHTYFLQANTIKIPKTKEKDRGTLTVGADSPLLIGIFAFNAFFVIIVFTVVLYCGCRKYKKFRKRKKDNSATVIHYHEIDDNIAGPSIDYDPLYTTGVTEKPQATEMKNFLVEYENEPLNREKKSFINTDSQKRRSETSPKQLARPSELVSEQTNMFEGYNAGEKSCKDNDAYIYTPVCKKANVRF